MVKPILEGTWRRLLWGTWPLDFRQFIFYASLCSYKSMKATSLAKFYWKI